MITERCILETEQTPNTPKEANSIYMEQSDYVVADETTPNGPEGKGCEENSIAPTLNKPQNFIYRTIVYGSIACLLAVVCTICIILYVQQNTDIKDLEKANHNKKIVKETYAMKKF